MNKNYREAAVEVLDILEHTPDYKVNLIPTKFINYLKENAERDYVVKLDYSKPLNEMNVKVETIGILGTICRNWWWTDEQKQEYVRLVREKELKLQEELRKKYSPDDLFKNKKQHQILLEKTEESNTPTYQMIKYKKGFFNIIINYIRHLFSK